MMPSIIGKVIDNYRIVEVLGKGGMGVVYKATDLTLDRDVALKMMDESLARDQSFLKRFQSEARALAKVQNPNIVSIFALRETEVGFCIVMEFVSGITLADVIRKGKIPVERALPIFRQVLTALGHAHGAGIVHRDIKPSNVMLTDNDTVKVTDFGLAKIQQPSAATMTVGTGGTLYYMPPEQVRGLANVDHRGDIYSTGMSLYEALVGKTPFSDDETDFSIRQAIVEGKIASPEKMNPSLPKDIIRVIQKSIEKDPARRYQTTAEFVEALERCAPQASQKDGRPAVGDAQKNPTRPRSKVMPVAVSASVLLLIALVSYMIVSGPGTVVGTISLSSLPDRATVRINNNFVGETPVSKYSMAPGNFSVRLDKQGFRSLDTAFSLGAGEDFNVLLALVEESSKVPTNNKGNALGSTDRGTLPVRETGTLILEAIPNTGVRVSIDDNAVSFAGRNSIEREHVSGTAAIVFEHSSGAQKRFNVNVHAGKQQKIICYFEADVNIVALLNNESAYAAVKVNGKEVNPTPTAVTLPLGKHRIEVTKFGYSSQEGSVEISVEPSSERKKIPLVFHLLKSN